MSLARALTTRMRTRFEDGPAPPLSPNRAYSTKNANRSAQAFNRNMISLPVELLSTSNSLAYEAPDIGKITATMAHDQPDLSQPLSPMPPADGASPLSSAASTNSWDEPLSSPALTSASSVTSHEDSRDSSPANPDPAQLNAFFADKEAARKRSARDLHPAALPSPRLAVPAAPATAPEPDAAVASPDAPEIPKRSLTHTKRTHQVLARQRSRSRLSSPRASVDNSSRASSDLHSVSSAKPDADHPFGAELEKVNELVEELSSPTKLSHGVQILDEETQYLIDHGFQRLRAEDYILEIQPLFSKAFVDDSMPVITEWI